MQTLLSNVFNDPQNPWYYVIGTLFLVLIFGALAAYIFFSNKRNKNEKTKEPESQTDTVNADAEINYNNNESAQQNN